ncbi:glycoside hydrolase family 13 protein [Terriglobus roseus]|uniref:Oligo-1,6-glucosidase n=1 Tax=Terriglobus roseus TaxID=392734 RepID=A0A1G7MMR9_9BACT|nr:alpha-glucosidase [Terriglobus roseus]SDF62409.1 oligo-1,6-glucosidase [Terriglobus roseus]
MHDELIYGQTKHWWKESVVYQIYPRSFQDSNGDGIGDLPGITSRLDYLRDLGVDVIWLSPHYDSPNADNGYDIRDYRKVMREFGTMQDFDALLAGIKQRGMRLIVDLVANHTSDEHVWFIESRKSRDNPYRDYYLWRPGKIAANGAELPPNNFGSAFSGSAWTKDKGTGEYYLHLFAEKQPDLNWDNPAVREEIYSTMRFWLDKGVDGFRMDVIPFISKDATFPDVLPNESQVHINANGPHLQEYLQEMNREVLSKYDCMTVGEAHGITIEETPTLVDERRHELNMIFNFDAVRLNRDGRNWRQWKLTELKAIYARQYEALGVHSWNTIFLANHDNPRLVNAFGDDSDAYRVASAKVLATMLLTLKGTAYLYQGDELGMTNYRFRSIEEYDDIEAKNAWKFDVLTGKETAEHYLDNLARVSRDHARTPMQWDDSPHAGFTSPDAKPWLAVNPNYTTINAADARRDQDSIYHYMQQLLRLRKQTLAFVYGDYEDLAPEHPSLFLYARTLGEERFLVALNFSRETFALPDEFSKGQIVLANTASISSELGAWESRIVLA